MRVVMSILQLVVGLIAAYKGITHAPFDPGAIWFGVAAAWFALALHNK